LSKVFCLFFEQEGSRSDQRGNTGKDPQDAPYASGQPILNLGSGLSKIVCT